MGQPPSVRAGGSGAECIGAPRGTGGTETSQYLEEAESKESPVVVASEPGSAQTSGGGNAAVGVVGQEWSRQLLSEYKSTGPARGRSWNAPPERVRVPYTTGSGSWAPVPEYHGTREILWEAGGTTLQGELPLATDSERVP